MFVHFTREPWKFSKFNAYRVCFVVVVVVVFCCCCFLGGGGGGVGGGVREECLEQYSRPFI